MNTGHAIEYHNPTKSQRLLDKVRPFDLEVLDTSQIISALKKRLGSLPEMAAISELFPRLIRQPYDPQCGVRICLPNPYQLLEALGWKDTHESHAKLTYYACNSLPEFDPWLDSKLGATPPGVKRTQHSMLAWCRGRRHIQNPGELNFYEMNLVTSYFESGRKRFAPPIVAAQLEMSAKHMFPGTAFDQALVEMIYPNFRKLLYGNGLVLVHPGNVVDVGGGNWTATTYRGGHLGKMGIIGGGATDRTMYLGFL